MKLIVGLGNPGRNYAHNRHNVGFRCINYLAKLHSIKSKRIQCHSQVRIGNIADTEVLLAKPMAYVNLSGEAVQLLMRKYKIPIDNLIVVYDDLDLPLGKIRLRSGGSAGGHRGVNSIIGTLGTKDFCRIKIGIGRPEQERNTRSTTDKVISHVLSDFSPEEEAIIKPSVARAAEAIECILSQGLIAAMNKFN